jgi:hypothetical protein
MGFFLQAHGGLKHTWLVNYDDNLQISSQTRYWQMGFGATVGYQWLTGPKDNFVYGFIGGLEYYPKMIFKQNSPTDASAVLRNWYDLPFIGDNYTGLKVYLGIELGFAFLQRDLHW